MTNFPLPNGDNTCPARAEQADFGKWSSLDWWRPDNHNIALNHDQEEHYYDNWSGQVAVHTNHDADGDMGAVSIHRIWRRASPAAMHLLQQQKKDHFKNVVRMNYFPQSTNIPYLHITILYIYITYAPHSPPELLKPHQFFFFCPPSKNSQISIKNPTWAAFNHTSSTILPYTLFHYLPHSTNTHFVVPLSTTSNRKSKTRQQYS